uniref:LAGLIDADG endonuclease n=1 Tax=Powellomyces hirtus TaxID=109895 RepID=A0A4P8NQ31_9FUNG|nr:LAGLIDADG endonuclease [Powellomyces hirtus]
MVIFLFAISSHKLISFGYPNVLALKRIGPHDYDVLGQIIWSLLGDAWLDRIPTKKGFSYRFQLDQGDGPNTEYIYWLTRFFYERGYCASPIPNRIVIKVPACDRTGPKTRITYRLTLFTFTSFGWIYNAFYRNGIKVVPVMISDYLTPITLAALIMQDGSRQNSGVHIATNCFTYKECLFIADLLANTFYLQTSVISAGVPNQWRVSIWKGSMPLLRSIIGPHMIGQMARKIA